MLGLFSPRCPIGPRERVWVERGMARLVDVLGLEWVRRTPVLTACDLQDVLSVEPVSAAAIAQRLAGQFPFAVEGIEWLEEPDINGQHAVEYVPGDPPTGVVPQQPNQTPELRTAHVARCLCQHAVATGAVGPLEDQPPYHVDLLSVLTGIGLFPANTTFSSKNSREGLMESWRHRQQPFMPSRLFGYAFALRCRLCDESSARWSTPMRPDAREPFEAGLKFLKKRRPVVWDEARDTFRSFGDPPPIDEVTGRLRHREAAVQINALDDVIEYGLNEVPVHHELGHLVHDGSDQVREEAIRAIVLLDAESAELAEALTIFCEDPVPRVRSLAGLALGEIRHPPADAVETLRTLTGDPEPIVNSAAAESLLGFPEGLADDRPRLFRVLRQQLARCNYEGVDRFVHRLDRSVTDAARLIEQEFAGTEEEPWRQILLESLAAAGANEAG